MNFFLRRGWWWPRWISTCPSTPNWQTRTCPIFMSWKPCSLLNHEAMWRNSLPGDPTGSSPMRASSISAITSTCPPEIVPATLHHSRPETGWPWPKGLDGEHPARLTQGEVNRDTCKAPCPLIPTWNPRLGLGQQLNSSLEADLVEDVVSHLSKVEMDCFVLNKPVARKKKKKKKSLI